MNKVSDSNCRKNENPMGMLSYKAFSYAALALCICSVTGCIDVRPPSYEQIKNNRLASQEKHSQLANQGRKLWSKAYQASSGIYSIEHRNEFKEVVTNVVLRADDYCADVLAGYGYTSADVDWRNFDRINSVKQECGRYEGIRKITHGDMRKYFPFRLTR